MSHKCLPTRTLMQVALRHVFISLTNTPHEHKQNLTHCGRVTQICVFNTVKLGTSASSP